MRKPKRPLQLYVDRRARNVWCLGVPADWSDAQVEATIRSWAARGNEDARRAIAVVPSPWTAIQPKRRSHERELHGARSYLDAAPVGMDGGAL
jgi:hypothetical protein